MKSVFKKIINILVLASFIAIVLFSFAFMMQGPDGSMTGDCPFSAMGQSLCPQDTVAIAIHHISSYHAFINVPVGTGMMTIILSLIFAICSVFIIFIRSPLLGPPAFARISYDSPSANLHTRKITRWLSLFENSPSNF